MAHITADRVRDTSTSTSTGNFTVSGTAPTGFRTFSAVLSAGDTFYYAIQGQGTSEWEVGLGTYSSANVFARTTILSSSNAGSVVTFSAGTKDVFLTLAATKTTQADGSGNISAPGSVSDSIGNVRSVPQNSKTTGYTLISSDAGKHISITTGGVTVPASVFSIGDTVTIYNNSGSNQTITQGASVTLRQVGTASTGNRTLAQYGLCTILCVASNTFVITGGGLT